MKSSNYFRRKPVAFQIDGELIERERKLRVQDKS
jgi:hypothetical protein